MIRVAIIGGGISGLTAALALEEARRTGAAEYTLYESSPHLGGVLRTERIHGCIVEAGPDSFITEKPWASDLCRTLGLGDPFAHDAHRIAGAALINGKIDLLAERLELVDRGRTIDVGRDEQRAPPLLFETQRELAGLSDKVRDLAKQLGR